MDSQIFNTKASWFSSAESRDATIPVHFSNERQGDLFVTGINQVIEYFDRLKGYRGQSTLWSYLPANTETRQDLPGESSWLIPLDPSEVLTKRYLFDLLDAWRYEVEIYDLVSRIGQSSEIINATRIALRLYQLQEIWGGESPDNCDMSSDSLRSFRDFLVFHPRVRYPDITLTPSGNIYARWKSDNKSLLSIQFLPERKVRFVSFVPNRKHANELNRISGNDFVDTVMDNLNRAYGVHNWVME